MGQSPFKIMINSGSGLGNLADCQKAHEATLCFMNGNLIDPVENCDKIRCLLFCGNRLGVKLENV